MKRSEFLQKLGLGFLGLSMIREEAKPKLVIYTGYIAGIAYYELKSIYHYLSVGQSLTLRREGGNEYDSNAISVWFNGHKLGYVAKKDNTVLANLLDGEFSLKAEVSFMKKEKFMPPEKVRFSVYRG